MRASRWQREVGVVDGWARSKVAGPLEVPTGAWGQKGLSREQDQDTALDARPMKVNIPFQAMGATKGFLAGD